MKRTILLIIALAIATQVAHPQEHRFITPPGQVIAIRAGRMFDSRSGTLLTNQTILIRGDRIVEAERVSQTMPDDASADEARRRGPDEAI